ncbi:MAG: hypothetical protein CMP07_13845 [Xanthomonadales bacterium]|nr:hypothetical protein [Xanthomonadales bacterium]
MFEIVGAGPAGLSAALAARARGAEVMVHEQRANAGMRFHGDFQGLENWTSDTDVLAELESLGIQTSFDYTAVREIVCFAPDGSDHRLRAKRPLFYLLRRGREPGSLDQALKNQALHAGVTIQFNNRRRHLPNGGAVAEGPHRADVIAVGYVFDTDMADGCYAAVGERLAGAGYSYLLVDKGRGTLAACLFDRFHDERQFLDETVAFFRQAAGLRWNNAKRFGGTGNYHHPHGAVLGNRSYVGEAAGFQDALFGFGLRHALISGHLAGSAGSSNAYDKAWRRRLSALQAASLFNRWLYARLGDRGRNILIKYLIAGSDPRRQLQRIYSPAPWKSALSRWLPGQPPQPADSAHRNCDCTWCRCQRNTAGQE